MAARVGGWRGRDESVSFAEQSDQLPAHARRLRYVMATTRVCALVLCRGRMIDRDYWTLYAEGPHLPRHFIAGVHSSRASALDAAQRLWKQGLHPTRIVGPGGEIIDTVEIDRYGREHPDAAD